MECYKDGILPEELVNDILLRLPVKALLVCKCVCKEWCALIKSPNFVNRHFNRESNPRRLAFKIHGDLRNRYHFSIYQDDERYSFVEEPNSLDQMQARGIILGQEKGIFCVVNPHNTRGIDLWNPAMIEFKTLPQHPLQRGAVIGFGLDPSSGDFKVVAFEHSKNLNSAFVYNLSSDSWKRIETIDLKDIIVFDYRMETLILNGVSYWLGTLKDGGVPPILAFDMKSEKFQEILIPDDLRHTKRKVQMTAYGYLLALLSFKNDNYIDMWVMGRDGLWVKCFTTGPYQQYMKPLFVLKNKLFLNLPLSTTLIICDISTQEVTTLIPKSFINDDESFVCDHFIYKESLVSVRERAD